MGYNLVGWSAFRRFVLAANVCSCVFVAGMCAADTIPAAAADGVVQVKLNPLGLADSDTVIGGTEQRSCVLPVNTALLRRVVLTPDDLQEVTMQLSCKSPGWRMQTLAEGKEGNGARIELAKIPSLQKIAIKAGETLALAVWKADWHWHGGGTLRGLRIVRAGNEGQAVDLASLLQEGGEKSTLGEFGFAGFSKRERLPEIERVVAATSEKPGAYVVPGTGGRVSMSFNNQNGFIFHTNGRANHEAIYDWVPALTFRAAADGVYSLEGTLEISSARPEKSIVWIAGKLQQPGKALTGTKLAIYRMLRPSGEQPAAGTDYQLPALAEAEITSSGEKPVTLDISLTQPMRVWLADGQKDFGLLIKAEKSGEPAPAVQILKEVAGNATVRKHPSHVLFDHKVKPRPGVYATMKNGRLYYGEDRLRLWGVVAGGSGERNRSLGFNCLRAWGSDNFYNQQSAKEGVAMSYVKGDGSKLDQFDSNIADVIQNDMFIMLATTCGMGLPLKPALEDGSWLHAIYGKEADWPEWKAALQGQPEQRGAWNVSGLVSQLSFIDPRLWAVRLRHARNVLDHRNPYTGKRYAEEEAIALIEINNEAGLFKTWIEKGFSGWPAYFRSAFQKQWNKWLLERYKNDEALRAAWGKLDNGESLATSAVKLEPVLSSRLRYPQSRLADFTAFIYQTLANKNREYVQMCRSLAPAGRGANVVPFSYDSQYRPSVPWAYTNFMGDTSTVSMYFWNTPSMLTSSPAFYVLDSHRVDDRLAVIYETQRGRPSPYRTEFPYMLSVMTCWQDFDIVVFHGAWIGSKTPAEQLLAATVQPPVSSHFWNAVHFENDPVMSSAIAAAGRLFLNGMIEEAPAPVTYTIGKQAIFSYDVFNGIGSRQMSRNTLSQGTRLKFAPDRDCGVLVEGSQTSASSPEADSLSTGKYAIWDWRNSRLIVDAPNAKIYVGKSVPSYTFKDGITISGFNTPFLSFALISADNKPLLGNDACRKAYINAAFDCKNTGFDYDYSAPGGPLEQAKAVRNPGHAPIIVDPVSYTVSFPDSFDAAFVGYDFAMRETSRTVLKGTNTLRQKGQTIWMGLLEFTARGATMAVERDPSPGASAGDAVAVSKSAETTDAGLAGIQNPVPNLSWGDNYARARRVLEDSMFIKTSVSPGDYSDNTEKTIQVGEAEILARTPADVGLSFRNDRMKQIVVTFCQAPAFTQLVAELEKQYGVPAAKSLADSAAFQSEVKWLLKHEKAKLAILATEVQGVVRIIYSLEE